MLCLEAGMVPAVMLAGLKLIRVEDWNAFTATAQPITPRKKIAAVKSA